MQNLYSPFSILLNSAFCHAPFCTSHHFILLCSLYCCSILLCSLYCCFTLLFSAPFLLHFCSISVPSCTLHSFVAFISAPSPFICCILLHLFCPIIYPLHCHFTATLLPFCCSIFAARNCMEVGLVCTFALLKCCACSQRDRPRESLHPFEDARRNLHEDIDDLVTDLFLL
jgi:hypothetical protein